MAPGDELIMVTGKEEYHSIYAGNPYIDKILRVDEEQEKALVAKYIKYDTNEIFRGRGKLEEFETKSGKDLACVLDAGKAFYWCTRHHKLEQTKVNGRMTTIMTVPHLSYGFADQLKVNIDGTHYDICLTEEEIEWGKQYINKHDKPVLLCAALSKSCTSRDTSGIKLPPNKMISAEIWNSVVEELKGEYDFVFLAGPNEPILEGIKGEWERGLPIRKVAGICKACAAVVSVDTGIGHIAQGVDANIVSICAAVARSQTSVEATRGKYYCVDHTNQNPAVNTGIQYVEAEEIVTGIKIVTS
jgi:hypothetical protein